MTKKARRKIFAGILTLAMVLTSIVWPGQVDKVAEAAALTINEEEYDATNILSVKDEDKQNGILTSTQTDKAHNGDNGYNGYILSNTGKALTSKYLKITYTIEDTSSLTEESNLFNFQPYTSGFGGWQDNFIKFKDAIDNEDGSYTSYIAVRSIKESMDDNQDCFGINLNFCQSEPAITLTGYYAMSVKATKGEADLYTDVDAALLASAENISITGQQMADAGLDVQKLIDTKTSVTPYIQFTKAHTQSWIKFSCVGNGSSNKALVGTKFSKGTDNGASTTNFVIHCGYGTTAGPGKGVGAAGTGIYNKIPSLDTNKWSGQAVSAVSLRLQILTKDTECKLLGVIFGDGQSFAVNDDGTLTKDFQTEEIKAESQTPDDTDVLPKSEAELKSEAEDTLWEQIRSAKRIKQEDCLTEAAFNSLQEAIEMAQAALDAADATSATLNSAIDKLNKAVKDANNEAPVGLKKAIDYCKSLKAEDYTVASFEKLAPAITNAEEVYAVYASKTDAELKAARDALEEVRVALVPKMSDAASNPKDFRILSKTEVVKEMGAGINLGNTMDGGDASHSAETAWQAYTTTKAYIKALHDAGYNTVRIPVTWGEYINEDYSIQEAWMKRVQEIVDYCVDQDMYAIINIHHDGTANHDYRGDNTPTSWLDTYEWDIEKVYQKFGGVWKSIANRFKDYDEHLIFESMNEVTDAHKLSGDQKNEDEKVLNALNQLFINTVRATGSNNTKRWLAITGRFATTNAITTMPEDTLADAGELGTTRLMFSVHIYKGSTSVRWQYADKSGGLQAWWESLSSSSKNVAALDENMPLYIGEYGVRTQVQDGSATGYNNAERALYEEICAAACDFYGAVPIVWDQGTGNYLNVKTETGLFTDWDRPNLKPVYDDVVYGAIRGTYEAREGNLGERMSKIYMSYGHPSTSDNSVSTDPEITPATDITLSDTSLTMTAGERKTVTAESDSARDMVLWTTDDDSVATVSRGLIHAKGIGITTIHAKSQLGSVDKAIKVIVAPSGKESATAIKTDKAYYEITEGDTVDIQTTLTPADSKDSVTYTSSNTDIATVSSSGKITGENPGLTYIIVTAASGVTNIAAVKVNKKDNSGTVEVKLNVMFANPSITEASQPLTISKNGQYTLTYDLAADLSDKGQEAGLTKLEKLTSIYIRDTNTLKPVVSQAKIKYDEIKVNDQALTLKKDDKMDEEGYRSLLKDSGQLDSNGPINAWEDNIVEETTTNSDHQLSFTGIDNPTKISITFTIKDLEFFPVKEKAKEATKLESVTENKFVLGAVGDTREIELSVTPADSDSEITFYSTDSSVAAVNNSKVTVDAEGKVKINVTALKEGIATIVGITENCLKVFYTVGVGNMKASDLPDPKDPTPPGLDGSVVKDPTPTPSPSPTPTKSPNGNSNVTVKKKSVIIAAGKSATVGFAAPSTPKIETSNKKIATAKVKGKNILISVPKKATKGAAAKITITAGSKSAVIKVTVKNPAKKIKAVRKSVTVKKKKKAALKFKITATNKKKTAADTIKVTSNKKKVAKVLKYSVKKGKATVNIQGVKKGKATVTLRIGKKLAKVTIKVK